jgi:long-chain acyl-CoA synthetase
MNFLEDIFERLGRSTDLPVLQQIDKGKLLPSNGRQVLALVHAARKFLLDAGLKKGDRCALLAANDVRWAAVDLAAMAEGIIVVPLYSRQAPSELVAMMLDCTPSLVICGYAALRDRVAQVWPQMPPAVLFEEIFLRGAGMAGDERGPVALQDSDPLTIIYTSGTSGEPKGVVLNLGNVNHMLRCTTERLDVLMGQTIEKLHPSKTGLGGAPSSLAGAPPHRVFHYLPFCFAGSWILLLSCLSRNAVLTINTDLDRIKQDLEVAAPDYFLNVPTFLERVRTGIAGEIKRRGGVAVTIFEHALKTYLGGHAGKSGIREAFWLMLAGALIFPKIRANIGPNLKALICGSAPLAVETQLFFMMLGIPVLQVYGLTETTAICTMDDPRHVEAGKVGPAIPGLEMRTGENEEILVRGSNVFSGYWNRPQETAKVLRDGWFHTGDQGEVDADGNWRIIGRIKNLIILNSGHNIAPEPLEDELQRRLPGAQQVVLVGNGCSFLAAIITGNCSRSDIERTLGEFNRELPHYKRIRGFYLSPEPLSVDHGLLTANGKLKRDAIAAHFRSEIDQMYAAALAPQQSKTGLAGDPAMESAKPA